MKKYLKIAVLVFLLSCTEIERDNPYDEHYVGNASKEGSSSSVESLSVPSSGSLGGGYSGSYGSLTYEGQTYKTVVIGTQTWMAENLNYAASGSKCYNNLEANCTIYGRLYNLETAKTVCPSGWHLPTDDEWRNIIDENIGGPNTVGKKLKATSGWNNNGNGTDEYGFSALPGGSGTSGGNFTYVGAYGFWWMDSHYNESVGMVYNSENASWYDTNESNLLSVRCVSGNQLSITGFDITDYPTTGILLSGEITGETVTGVAITANGNAVSLINLPALGVNRVDLSGTYVSGVCGTSSEIITVNFAITATASDGTTATATKNDVSIDCGGGPDPPLVKTPITLSYAGNSYADLDNGKTYGQEAAAAIKNKIDLIAYSGEVGESGNLGAIYTPDELDFFWDFDGNYWSYLGGDVYFSPIPADIVAILRNATKFSDIAGFAGGLWYDDFELLTEIPAVKDTSFLVSTTEGNLFAVTIESAGEGRVDLVIVELR